MKQCPTFTDSYLAWPLDSEADGLAGGSRGRSRGLDGESGEGRRSSDAMWGICCAPAPATLPAALRPGPARRLASACDLWPASCRRARTRRRFPRGRRELGELRVS